MTNAASAALWDRLFSHDAYLVDRFRNFSPLHFASVAGCVAAIAAALWLDARATERGRRRFEIVLAGLMLFGTVSQITWSVLSGQFDPGRDLILFHMCGVFTLVGAVLLLIPKRGPLLQDAIYFAGLPGACMALLTPDLVYAFPHFMYLMFFLSHAMIVTAALHFILVRKHRPRPQAIPRIFLLLNLLLIPVYLVDRLTDGNYFYLLRPPPDTLAVVFAEWVGWGWYLIPMELVALLMFGLLSLPWIRWKRRSEGENAKEA